MAARPDGWLPCVGVLLAALTIVYTEVTDKPSMKECDNTQTSIYTDEFQYSDLMKPHEIHHMSEYSGKVVLIVNVATYWMYTFSNYLQLNELHTEYNDKGLEIIGFPCNQFGLQEPGKNGEEIMSGIECVRPGGAFYPFFQMAEKVDVVGVDVHPLFKRLTKMECPEEPNEAFHENNNLFYTNLTSYDIRWNFEKFLIGRDGIPAYRFEPAFEPRDMSDYIKGLLKQIGG